MAFRIALFAGVAIASFVRSGYPKTGGTVRELATSAGVDAGDIEQTIDQINRDAKVDSAFGRGETSSQRLLATVISRAIPVSAKFLFRRSML